MKIIAVSDEGTETDITEGVQVLYDTVLQSMDWSSGFLDYEEQSAVIRTGMACGFPDAEKHLESIQRAKLAEEKRQEQQVRRDAERRARIEETRASWQDVAPRLAGLPVPVGSASIVVFRP